MLGRKETKIHMFEIKTNIMQESSPWNLLVEALITELAINNFGAQTEVPAFKNNTRK